MAKRKTAKGISRIDSASTHGWFVRAYRNGTVHSKLFSDRKCGGKMKARKLAEAYRDELFEQMESIPKKPRKARIVIADARSSTGERGVTRVVKKAANGREYAVYAVSWRPIPGHSKSTAFSINKYGEKKALKMAIQFRRARMKEIHGDDFYRKLAVKRRQKKESV